MGKNSESQTCQKSIESMLESLSQSSPSGPLGFQTVSEESQKSSISALCIYLHNSCVH